MDKAQENLLRTAHIFNVTNYDSSLTQDIILYRRGYFIRKVKQPLMSALVWAFDKRTRLDWLNNILDRVRLFVAAWNIMQSVFRYPEPTRENCRYPLTLGFMDIWDEFFMWFNNPEHPDAKRNPYYGREQLYRAIRRVMLSTVEHDLWHKQMIHWFTKRTHDAYRDGGIPEQMPIEPDRRLGWKEPVREEDLLAFMGKHSK